MCKLNQLNTRTYSTFNLQYAFTFILAFSVIKKDLSENFTEGDAFMGLPDFTIRSRGAPRFANLFMGASKCY